MNTHGLGAGPAGDARWADALMALDLLAHAPQRWGGVWLRAPHGPVRDTWLAALAQAGLRVWRAPSSVDRERWLGGLDLGATLRTGHLQTQAGLLQQADGGVLCLPMAERLPAAHAASLAQTLDRAGLEVAGQWHSSRLVVVALDESGEDEPPLAGVLQERLALWLDLREVAPAHASAWTAPTEPATRPDVVVGEQALQTLCATAWALGIGSLRAPQWALAVASAHAQRHGRDHLAEEDLAFACRTVLAPRATQWPHSEAEPAQAHEPPPEPPPEPAPTPSQTPTEAAQAPPPQTPQPAPSETTADATLAQLPADLLLRLMAGALPPRTAGQARGTSGHTRAGRGRGRPLPPRPGRPGGGERLHLLATLRAAAPRQRLRGRHSPHERLQLRLEDCHVHRHQQHQPSCLILALDASGSSALHRLAEAKGAVQLLLEQSYARRDNVCVIGFRGARAQVLLPPTRSLVRARRALSGLPGGGGTPLASALQLAQQQAQQLQRQGVTPILVVLSDGRANVTLQGLGGRLQAQQEAELAARAWGQDGHTSLWIDTAPTPEAQAQRLAQHMGARYLPMPHVQSHGLAQALEHARTLG